MSAEAASLHREAEALRAAAEGPECEPEELPREEDTGSDAASDLEELTADQDDKRWERSHR